MKDYDVNTGAVAETTIHYRVWELVILVYMMVNDVARPHAKKVTLSKCKYPVSGSYTLDDCVRRAEAELRTFLSENPHVKSAHAEWFTISEE